ncbi:zinc ribbon domain-containing protein [Paraburkholderia caballeronis]|uniref:Putative regulatory protein, FmdB family n=1 Tax=Paraburkholderia caballeronis TaxID=416943 RepID=A0A1H7F3R9_9BURK|nr:zinc ribbon domain-containing protein [Paraburkholderia caballeronis]PXW23868.1 putative FmdB family regulatory protein [Paraburkholderia caballeronis]PXW99632.1 putative FmdB family regulatory protein [Paraburkholderia caballeronis]RAJ96586.1 putative FmdB family regulatory protein [Paraburkholderia caballeronis]TDV15570.1 putative FmdB family regulatory protein [Paraburkholderia caballeronis]TDV17825.1 putative FmdB family regulatory protein [Paraburkholderia caballeronis]
MPVYDYLCADCGVFDAVRRIAQRDDALCCPRCGADAQRVTVAAPALASGATDSGSSSGEGRYGGMRHVGGCTCCG